jgi:hypothetical protein
MKALRIFFWSVVAFLSVSFVGIVSANENDLSQLSQSKKERYFQHKYQKLSFHKMNKLRYEVFEKAFHGYLNMVQEGKVRFGDLLTVCDFTLSSNTERLWVIDVKNNKVLFNTLVAHGQGTGEEYAVHFSNTHDSHQSSLGFYITGETYEGNNGYSLKLHGVDGQFNSNAYDRAIVIHGADYVSESFCKANQRLGRSHGCPALPVEVAPKIIDKIKDGHVLFIYHSQKNYLTGSRWLTKPLHTLPAEADRFDLQDPNQILKKNPRYVASLNDDVNTSKSSDNDENLQPTPEYLEEPVVSAEDRANYKIDVQTIIIKKGDKNIPKEKVISEITIIDQVK